MREQMIADAAAAAAAKAAAAEAATEGAAEGGAEGGEGEKPAEGEEGAAPAPAPPAAQEDTTASKANLKKQESSKEAGFVLVVNTVVSKKTLPLSTCSIFSRK